MRAVWSRQIFLVIFLLAGATAAPLKAQQDSFRWMDFSNAKDQDIVVWVTRSMSAEKWSAIREIGVVYDAALVVTTLRTNSQGSPGSDTFALWSVSLTNRTQPTPLLKGVNLRWVDWMQFSDNGTPEIAALYEDCNECAATTYFTAMHYDMAQHLWTTRWLRGGQTAPVWSTTTLAGVEVARIYAILAEPDGRVAMGTWNHFDYGKQKPAEDFIYRYDIDPFNGLDRMQLLSGKEADSMKQRLCGVPGNGLGTARGQDSALCQQTVHPRSERRPVTTPPANNQGRSVPPRARR